MTISELISELKKLEKTYGDLPVRWEVIGGKLDPNLVVVRESESDRFVVFQL